MSPDVYIIAEAGVNHNGELSRARDMIRVAAEAGADAIKFQTFIPELLASPEADKADYQKHNDGTQTSQLQMLQQLSLSFSGHLQLRDLAISCGIDFMSSPFDEKSADFLIQDMDLPVIKIGSGEITNAPMLSRLGCSGKKVILSTGMSNLADIETALAMLAYAYAFRIPPVSLEECLDWFRSAREASNNIRQKVSLLHCTTEYPCPTDEVNLRVMDTLRQRFGLPVGYSDHTQGIHISLAAAARGAVIIEKHFTLDKTLPGPDHVASINPDELQQMVKSIRDITRAMGSDIKQVTDSEAGNREIARKSLITTTTIKQGEFFSADNLTCMRPGTGLSPVHYWDIINTPAKRDYQAGEMLLSEEYPR